MRRSAASEISRAKRARVHGAVPSVDRNWRLGETKAKKRDNSLSGHHTIRNPKRRYGSCHRGLAVASAVTRACDHRRSARCARLLDFLDGSCAVHVEEDLGKHSELKKSVRRAANRPRHS